MRVLRPCYAWLLVVAIAGARPATTQAQSLTDVRAGSRVQLTIRDSLRQTPIWPSRQVIVGQFMRATSDSVWIRPVGASEFSVATRSITRAQESRGASRLRSALTYAFGCGFGFAAAVAIDRIDTDHEHKGRDVLIAGGVGFGGGLIIGAISPYEHWRTLKR